MAMRSSIAFLAVALFASGCAHYPINAPLAVMDGRTGYRFENTAFSTNSDALLLMLAFSGGGTRAAALDYGVLEELARTGVGPPSEQHRLLDEVDLISSVSGGSFTAAYYALWGDRIFSDFEPQFLKKRVQNELFRETMARLARETSAVRLTMNGPGELTIYTVELHFNQLADDSDRRFFNSVPTRLQLPSATVDRLRSIAAAELAGNDEFQRLIGDLRNGSNPVNFATGQEIGQTAERNSQ